MNVLVLALTLCLAAPHPEVVQPKREMRLGPKPLWQLDATPRLKTDRETLKLPDGYQVQTMRNEVEDWRFFFSPKCGWIGALILKSRIEQEIEIKTPILIIINEEQREKEWLVAYLLLNISTDDLDKLDVKRKPIAAGSDEEFLSDLKDYITRAEH